VAFIRHLSPSEAPKLEAHLLRLHPEDRRMRFGGGSLSDTAVSAYCRSINWPASVQIGYFADGELRGVAQLAVPDGAWPMLPGLPLAGQRIGAEFAISVERDHQRRGVGQALLERAVIAARNRSVGTLTMYCLPSNERMRRLATRCGIKLRFDQGEVAGHALLDNPDQLSVAAEYIDRAAAAFDEMRDFLAPTP
jgi:GNAT superfamily N-acetyltransferase